MLTIGLERLGLEDRVRRARSPFPTRTRAIIMHDQSPTYVCILTGNMNNEEKRNQFLGGSMASNGNAFIVSSSKM